MSWYILAVIPVLGLLVFVHELGHFIAAKWAGIRVDEFGMGFPPNIVSLRKRERGGWEVMWFGRGSSVMDTSNIQNPFGNASEELATPPERTLYSLNLLPLGGFVRMAGESGDTVDENGRYDEGSFAAKTAGKRIIVLCAGVFMNFLLGIVLFTVAYGLGEPMPTPTAVIGSIQANSPAAMAGLRADDTVLAVNGKAVKDFNAMSTAVTQIINADKGKDEHIPIRLTIQHSQQSGTQDVTVNARVHPPQGQGYMGVGAKVLTMHYPLWQAPFRGIAHTFDFIHQYLSIIGKMIIGAIQPQFSGPVGIAQVTQSVAEQTPVVGWWPILSLTAALSLNLAIFNILPFPALDGGRVFLILVEILRGGKRLKPEREGLINLVGFALLLVLMVVVTVSDLMHWNG
ncbi:M50 family metallopeptidase [Dictyobacter kobayashii]|uniref:RIP metalloprotease RseP n=1 Tax=Dictyobacter kobayashii TaxID=2014872 RepID=A0A402AE98_9CHLR|nr:M50 family metallopeptidase [Dictyobacter kobayashii]GCE17430.1 RIP metalloprotease RseP [Dictyobacter kobayashii]